MSPTLFTRDQVIEHLTKRVARTGDDMRLYRQGDHRALVRHRRACTRMLAIMSTKAYLFSKVDADTINNTLQAVVADCNQLQTGRQATPTL
jgi:hypothetical protein